MESLIKLFLRNQLKPNRYSINSNISGFTLLELLVAMTMTFLILTPLLTFVVNMLDTDRKEQVKSNTEQDMQTAVDFIAQDMSQAVYIYNNTGINAIKANLPNTSTYGTPVLVFWKRELVKQIIPIPSSALAPNCKTNPDSCNDTYVYSLVAYYLDPNNAGTIWSTKAARIKRFSIRDCVPDPNDSTGRCITDSPILASKVDTSKAQGNTPNNFEPFNLKLSGANLSEKMNKWPKQISNAGQEVDPSGFTFALPGDVLIDYVDKNTGTPAPTPNCVSPDEEQVPATLSGGFYACVNSSRNLARVFIRGNAQARLQKNITYNDNNKDYFPTVSAQVQGLGVLGQ